MLSFFQDCKKKLITDCYFSNLRKQLLDSYKRKLGEINRKYVLLLRLEGRGSWSAERFLKLDWSAERKRENRSELGAPIFFLIFPIFSRFHKDFTVDF